MFLLLALGLFERITLNPGVMTGKPIIRGTRLTVQFILGLLAHGATEEEIPDEYKELNEDDIKACFHTYTFILFRP